MEATLPPIVLGGVRTASSSFSGGVVGSSRSGWGNFKMEVTARWIGLKLKRRWQALIMKRNQCHVQLTWTRGTQSTASLFIDTAVRATPGLSASTMSTPADPSTRTDMCNACGKYFPRAQMRRCSACQCVARPRRAPR